jgi:hypothetical protein
MVDNFELVSSGIRVRDTTGNKINRVTTPHGFTDLMFRNVVAAYDTAYRMQGKMPSVAEVCKIYPAAPAKTVSALFLTEEFKQALTYRGVEFGVDSGLSMEQQMALLKLNDFTDRRSTSTKLKEMGIPMSRYQAWMAQPLFALAGNQMAERGLEGANTMLISRVLGAADGGDTRMIELALKMTGRWNPDNLALEDAKAVVLKMVESVMQHVTDPKIREAILSDMRAQAVSYDLTHRPIEG